LRFFIKNVHGKRKLTVASNNNQILSKSVKMELPKRSLLPDMLAHQE